MKKAFVDTTVLTDALLKTGEQKEIARKALQCFDVTELPVYAIKEFKAGPLNNYIWMHNKLALLGSFEKALSALQAMSRSPRRYLTSTALQGLATASGSIAKKTVGDWFKKYGEQVLVDKAMCDEFRLTLKVTIFKAWKRRRNITTHIVLPIYCYKETPPCENDRGIIVLNNLECSLSEECKLASFLKNKPEDLQNLRDSIKDSNKPENINRSKVLRKLLRTPKLPIANKDCRYLGDVIFVFFAPLDSTILTTNIIDFKPLAESLNKKALSPQELPI